MNFPELLSPAGDFDCLKAAVQNGADAVYLGASAFSARASATNFDLNTLKEAILYAHLRGCKVHLALNTLLKENEFEDAIVLAKSAYEYGIDAVIVQDLGLASFLIDNFKGLDVHGSTQMTVHNSAGVNELEKIGFSRVVLSRELSLEEIKHIVKNSNIEVEAFIHGALCISYSGQCLFSSMVGGRSGNRGKCAQPCRLPYELIDDCNNVLDNGFLLSPRDLCSLKALPDLIDAKVNSFKIEGRMKTPEYVATVTRIYRKYIDFYLEHGRNNYSVNLHDKKALMQVFNRGGFSLGHLENNENLELIFKDKPNNMGLPLGTILAYNKNKGYITFTSAEPLALGDTIMVEKENTKYTISELMVNDKNEPNTFQNTTVKIGRMKGNISVGDKLYKLSSNELSTLAESSLRKENRKISLNARISIAKGTAISLNVYSFQNKKTLYDNLNFIVYSDVFPEKAINSPLTEEKVLNNIKKTGNTFINFENIQINMEPDVFFSISTINELRRKAIQYINDYISKKTLRKPLINLTLNRNNYTKISKEKNISLLLNNLSLENDYSKLKNINCLYIPLQYFLDKDFNSLLITLCNNFSVYVYMPTIAKEHYFNTIKAKLDGIVSSYNIHGFVVSNLGQIELVNKFGLELVSNYTMNISNSYSVSTLGRLGLNVFTMSPEFEKSAILNLLENSALQSEMIVYGRIPLMNTNYCPLGRSNKCYAECRKLCKSGKQFYLKDRLGIKFPVVPNSVNTVCTIYNSRILSVASSDFEVDRVRIDILNENVDEIQNIIDTIRSGNRLEGKNYTNGNLNRII